MREPSPHTQRRLSLALGLAGLAAAFVWFGLTAAPLDPATTTYRALGPYPDAPEYLDAAICFLETGRFEIDMAGDRFPSRFPPGYSLALAVPLALGVEPARAPLMINRAFSAALLLTLWGLFAWAGRPGTGGLAACLLAVQPWFILLARSPMSEPLAVWAAALAGGLLLLGGPRQRSAGAALLGLSVGVRLANVFLVPFVVAGCWGDRRALARSLAAFAAGAAPLALWQWATFGAPWATGYGFWLGVEAAPFGLEHLPVQLAMLANEVIQNESVESVAWIYGAGSYVGPATALLAAWAAVRLWRGGGRPRTFVAAAAAFAAPLLFYFYPDFRLYTPLAAGAVAAVAATLPDLWRAGGTARRATLGFLLAAALLGFPGRRSELEALDMLRALHLRWETPQGEALDALLALDPPPGSRALTDLNPPLVHALTGGRVTAAPLNDDHDYRFAPQRFRFAAAERAAFVEQAQSQGAATYLVAQGAANERSPR